MKTKSQKQTELNKGKKLLEKSQTLVFTDFTKLTAEELRRLRSELKKTGAEYLVIKKRLLGLILKEKGIDFDTKSHKVSMGTVFSEKDIENGLGTVVKFFSGLEDGKKKILGGFDVNNKALLEAEKVLMIGNLPPKEIILAQLLGMIQAPISSLLYIFQERSKKITA